MASSGASTFPLFALLPAEIQLQIWEYTLPSRQMHIFDIQTPPQSTTSLSKPPKPPRRAPSHRRTRSRSQSPGTKPLPTATTTTKLRHRKHPSTSSGTKRNAADLSSLSTVSLSAFAPIPTTLDPSGYLLRATLRTTCHDAARTARAAEAAIAPADRATITLPSNQRILYDNARDVLHLRFLLLTPAATAASDHQPQPLSALFQSLWSPALATALHGARRVAIDVAHIWPALGAVDKALQQRLVQDVVFLVCTLQNALEVLYLVDYSRPEGSAARALRSRDGELYSRLNESYCGNTLDRGAERLREPETIHGNGTVWREVFDLEGLGWHERHPGFVFGEMFGEVVRLQQGQWFGEGERKATFEGVKVLVAENELERVVESDYMDESVNGKSPN